MSGNNPFGANNQGLPPGVYSSPTQAQGQPGTIQQQLRDAEQELYLQRQLELGDLELRQLLGGQQQQQQQQQQQAQLLAALTNQPQTHQDQLLQQQLQQLAGIPQTSALLQQQQLFELQQQLANSPSSRGTLLSSILSGGNDGVRAANGGGGGTGVSGSGSSAENMLSQAIYQEMFAQQQRQAVQEQVQNHAQQPGAPVDAAHLQLQQRLAQATQRIQIQHGQQPPPVTAAGASPAPHPPAPTANGGHPNNSASAPTALDLLRTSPPVDSNTSTVSTSAPKKSPKPKKTKRKGTEGDGDKRSDPAKKKRKAKASVKEGKSNIGDTDATEAILLDDEEDDPLKPEHSPKRKDIAMLLKATEDPAVKDFDHYRQELARETKEVGLDLSLLVHEAAKKPPQDETDPPGSYKRIVSVLPKLPSEPDLLGSDDEGGHDAGIEAELISSSSLKQKQSILDRLKYNSKDKILELSAALQNCDGEIQDQDLTEPKFISQKEEETEPVVIACKSAVDSWWPSNSAVRKEMRAKKGTHLGDEEDDKPDPAKKGLFRKSKKTIRAIHSRIDGNIEPGVLQKLPHCKLHRHSSRMETKTPEGIVITHSEPMFCVQVTEAHCTDVMLCCSICSTWRHAQCGGHYTNAIPKGRPNAHFRPVCDRCFEESKLIKDNPIAQGRIARQRNEHLRRTLATTSVLRHACFSKHSGQYRWPLGQVAPTHIDSHLRSVHTRHDRAEKQWRDAVAKFGAKPSKKKNPKDSGKFRMKEFERLLGHVTDAEASTDLHNMLLFLQRDSARTVPAGFENTIFNFFDPDTPGVEDNDDADYASSVDTDVGCESNNGEPHSADGSDGNTSKDEGKAKPKTCACSRKGCNVRARFDSIFCSDGCGVSVAEGDLLKSMELAATLHPSALSRGIQYT